MVRVIRDSYRVFGKGGSGGDGGDRPLAADLPPTTGALDF